MVSKPDFTMATHKERIENLEAGPGGLQDSRSRMELGLNDKLQHMEEAINQLSRLCSQIKKYPTTTPMTVVVTLATIEKSLRRLRSEKDKCSQPSWQGLNFQDTPGTTQLNGSIESNNFSNIKAPWQHKK